MNKYFTPSIEDIRVGYECEIYDWAIPRHELTKDYRPKEWKRKIWSEHDFDESVFDRSMIDDIRVPYLTKEQIESFGFVLKAKSIDHWFQIAEDKRFDTDLQNFFGYKAYTAFLNYGFHDHRLKIKADFSGGLDFDKAETLFEGECKCINQLRQILKQIHITPFYGK